MKIKYSNKIKPRHFISILAFLTGVAFTNVIFTVSCFYDWVTYLGLLFSILFIIGAPAYFQDWLWGKIVLIFAFILFTVYNIYNVTADVFAGSDAAYVSIPIAISSICIILYLLNDKEHLEGYKRLFTFLNLFLIAMLSHWIWLFIELIKVSINDNSSDSKYFLFIAIGYLLLSMSTISVFSRKNFTRLILSVLLHIHIIFYLVLTFLTGGLSDSLFLTILLLLLNIIAILCLHSQEIINKTTNKTDFPDSANASPEI